MIIQLKYIRDSNVYCFCFITIISAPNFACFCRERIRAFSIDCRSIFFLWSCIQRSYNIFNNTFLLILFLLICIFSHSSLWWGLQLSKLSPCSEKRLIGHPSSSGAADSVPTTMTQLCESDAIASSSAAVAEAAAQVTGVPGFVDDMYFLRHILDMKPSSPSDDSNLEIVCLQEICILR